MRRVIYDLIYNIDGKVMRPDSDSMFGNTIIVGNKIIEDYYGTNESLETYVPVVVVDTAIETIDFVITSITNIRKWRNQDDNKVTIKEGAVIIISGTAVNMPDQEIILPIKGSNTTTYRELDISSESFSLNTSIDISGKYSITEEDLNYELQELEKELETNFNIKFSFDGLDILVVP